MSEFAPVGLSLLFLQSARLTLGRRATSGVHQSLTIFGLTGGGLAWMVLTLLMA
ncbi:hypothetical protein [Undibacterium sp. KW1]|uniref:hypothetical protein n=1 Tax=Undibacterium sp. KW1 TaxID=2058624 RepID=UPI001E2D61AE|nr:hypothetical protein [Undibacterium sp. KW1]